ncbi:intermediate filament protein ifa-1, partial [Trichinella spiralis]
SLRSINQTKKSINVEDASARELKG